MTRTVALAPYRDRNGATSFIIDESVVAVAPSVVEIEAFDGLEALPPGELNRNELRFL